MEEWRPVAGHYGYSVSNLGRIMRTITGPGTTAGRILRPRKSCHGYLTLSLSTGGKISNRPVHILVAKAFVPNPDGKKTVNHIDGAKTNNTVENLEWASHQEQQLHALALGLSARGERHRLSKLTEEDVAYIKGAYANGPAIRLAKQFGVSRQAIYDIMSERTWKHVPPASILAAVAKAMQK